MTLTTRSFDSGDKCTEVIVNGERCIAWQFVDPDPLANKSNEKERRRKLKDSFGPIHPDTVCLDNKLVAPDRRQYCDAIVYSEHVLIWKDAITQLHDSDSELTATQKDVPGGEQHTWWKRDNPYVAISFYACKKKFMIQPGDRKE